MYKPFQKLNTLKYMKLMLLLSSTLDRGMYETKAKKDLAAEKMDINDDCYQ